MFISQQGFHIQNKTLRTWVTTLPKQSKKFNNHSTMSSPRWAKTQPLRTHSLTGSGQLCSVGWLVPMLSMISNQNQNFKNAKENLCHHLPFTLRNDPKMSLISHVDTKCWVPYRSFYCFESSYNSFSFVFKIKASWEEVTIRRLKDWVLRNSMSSGDPHKCLQVNCSHSMAISCFCIVYSILQKKNTRFQSHLFVDSSRIVLVQNIRITGSLPVLSKNHSLLPHVSPFTSNTPTQLSSISLFPKHHSPQKIV